jgi:hypothetical protein
MNLFQSIFVLQIFCCFFLTGLIWNVQVIAYPTFEFVSELRFKEFHKFHSEHITWVVLPVMALELGTAMALVWLRWSVPWGLNLLSVVALWGVTAFLMVPIHDRLDQRRTSEEMNRLIHANWLRTGLWSFRTLAFAALLVKMLSPAL